MEKKKKPKSIPTLLKPADISRIKAEIKEFENQMSGREIMSDGVGYSEHTRKHIQNDDDIKHEIDKRKKTLERLTPKSYKGEQANKAWAWAKKTQKWIHENMPTQKQFRTMYDSDDFDREVLRQEKWQRHGDRVVDNYRYVMRRLDPSDPTLGDVERLRRRG
jgi:hypothetical protein